MLSPYEAAKQQAREIEIGRNYQACNSPLDLDDYAQLWSRHNGPRWDKNYDAIHNPVEYTEGREGMFSGADLLF
ncbi:hypothetical protein [Acidipila sp. EB88]|uniref:hypothetical protein n=1 Tax=Acidipila sp. EB88 TaxID=2305226 RepID=UPI000F5F0E60|nr:hypothetical protein [Acidipila sp. EB88]RRA49167.1 hypothetical protein D1Y84_13695 [Acidipila sp. EB88]